jgi:CDP-diglyceride synthetase
MRALSAIIFAAAGGVGGVLGEAWHMHRDPHYSPDLGMEGAILGLALFGAVYAIMIWVYAAASTVIRRGEIIAAPVLSALVGLPFWFLVLPLHTFLRDGLGLPDSLWWLETALVCAVSFEIIRICHVFKTKMA